MGPPHFANSLDEARLLLGILGVVALGVWSALRLSRAVHEHGAEVCSAGSSPTERISGLGLAVAARADGTDTGLFVDPV